MALALDDLLRLVAVLLGPPHQVGVLGGRSPGNHPMRVEINVLLFFLLLANALHELSPEGLCHFLLNGTLAMLMAHLLDNLTRLRLNVVVRYVDLPGLGACLVDQG